jgi:hypothetical protein
MNDSQLHGSKAGVLLLLGLLVWDAFYGFSIGQSEGPPAGTTYTHPSGAKVTILPEGSVCTAPDGHRV